MFLLSICLVSRMSISWKPSKVRPNSQDLVSYQRIPGFESYIGHTDINLSNTILDEHQTKALEKGLTFCPTPGPRDKSQIWSDFKEFHRRLELVEFFNRDTKDNDNPSISQSIIDFMNNNATEEPSDGDMEDLKNKEIHKILKPKSGWRPSPPNKTLETFQTSGQTRNSEIQTKTQKV